MSKSVKQMLIIFGLALLIRIINIFLLIPDGFNFQSDDQEIYVNLGLSMLQTGDFVYQTGSGFKIETARTPLYPTLLSIIWSITNYNPWAIVLIQSVLDALSCVMIGLVVSKVIPGAFVLGGIFSVFNMNMIVSSGMILTDSLFLLLFTLFLWSTLTYLNKGNLKYMILLSAMLSLSILTRPVAYYLVFILSIVFLWYLILKKESFKKIFFHITAFLLVIVIFLIPLIERNYHKFDSILITSQSGLHLSRYLVPLAVHFSEGVTYAEATTKIVSDIERSKQDNFINNKNPFKSSYYESGIAMDHLLNLGILKITYSWLVGSVLNLSSSGVMAMPWLRSLPHKSFYNTPGDNFIQKIFIFSTDIASFKYLAVVVVANLISLLMFILKLFGVYSIVRDRDEYGGGWNVFFILGVIGYFLLITGPVIGVKYLLPIEPLLTILLIAGIRLVFRDFFYFLTHGRNGKNPY